MSKEPLKILESDLYEPIFKYLTNQGYAVHSEVKNCDVTAIKGDELIIIELKKSFNATLLMQAVKRQRAADSVYVAIAKPKGGRFSSNWDEMCHLLRRLELGLMVVSFKGKKRELEIVFHPDTFERKKNNRLRRSIIKEASGRYGDFNVGGSTGKKIMTVYREESVHIACCLERNGQLSPCQLKKLGTSEKTQSILSKNFYGWFGKVGRGIYELTEEGIKALEEYKELADYYRGRID